MLLKLNGNWYGWTYVGKVNDKTLYSNSKGSSLDFSFKGKWFSLTDIQDKLYGVEDLYIDNNFVNEINFNSNQTKYD